MRNIFKFIRTEFLMQLYTPVYWLIVLVFLIQTGILFCGSLDFMVKGQQLNSGLNNITFLLFSSPSSGLFGKVQNYMYLYIPLLTMGIFSRELSSGSIKLLYSSPISNAVIVATKFLSLVLVGGVLMLILCIYAGISIWITDTPDVGAIIAGLIGLFLLLLSYISIGMFMSSITSYSVVAALGTLIVFSVLNYVGNLWQDMPVVQDVLYWLNLSGRANAFINGMVTTEDVLYFVLVTGMFLLFTYFKLSAHTNNASPFRRVINYAGVFIVVGLIGYLSSLPVSKKYFDLTADKRNTLSDESRKILSKVDGKLTIHTYVNMLYEHYQVLPIAYKNDQKRLEQYFRFKPQINMQYHYYSKLTEESPLRKKYAGLNEKQIFDTLKMINEWDFPVLPVDQMQHKAILASEEYRFVRVLEYEDGSTAILRTYKDLMRAPFELENSSAFKSLMEGNVRIGFFDANGERSLQSQRKDGIKTLFATPVNRSSFVNLGFSAVALNTAAPIPDSIDMLVIAAPEVPYTDPVLENIAAYHARGGNLAILCESRSAPWMNPWLERFGIHLDTSLITHDHPRLEKEELLALPVKDSAHFAPFYDMMNVQGVAVITPGATAIRTANTAVKPILEAKNSHGESLMIAAAITPNANEKQGKLFVMTDADWLGNEEIFKQREGVVSGNYQFAKAIFYWMSDGRYPIHITRSKPLDNAIFITPKEWKPIRILLLYILPGIIVCFAALLLYRRSRI